MEDGFRGLLQRLKSIAKSSIFQNVLSLQSVEILKKLVPLLLVPYLARVLGAGGWGLVAFSKSFSGYLVMLIEYGFNLTVTRRISRNKEDSSELDKIFSDVTGATVLIVTIAVLGGYGASFVISQFENSLLLWATIGYALAQGLHPVWWFLGLERMGKLALFEGIGKIVNLVTIFILVDGPNDVWLTVALYALGSGTATILGFIWALREVSLIKPRLRGIAQVMKNGFSMFVYRFATSLYTKGNSFILGLFVAPQYVGYFAGAEKISRASWSMLTPVGRALFPRLSDLVKTNKGKAVRLARISIGVLGGASIFLGVFIIYAAPQLVNLLLGDGYGPAVPILQIFSAIPLLTALHNVLGVQWMLPLGMDWYFNTIIIIGGLVNISLAVILIPKLSYHGMAYSFVASKILMPFMMFSLLAYINDNPLIKS